MSRNTRKTKISIGKPSTSPVEAPAPRPVIPSVQPAVAAISPKLAVSRTPPSSAVTNPSPKTAVVASASLKTASLTPSPKPDAPKVGRVTFQLVKPGAKHVCVAGSFNEWKPDQTPLVRVGADRWVGDLKIRPGRHEYLFVVDGQWLPDPNANETVVNPYGGKNSVLTVSE